MRLKATVLIPALALLVLPAAAGATGTHTHHHHCGHTECDPDTVGSGSVTVDGPFGAYTVVKDHEIYAADNCGNPNPVPGSFTYVYKISNDAGSSVGVTGYSIQVVDAPNKVSDQGFIDGAGVEPSAQSIGANEVRWDFDAPLIAPGEMSEYVWMVSPYQPGSTDVTINGEFALDAGTQNIGPVELPEPAPCSAFFWKLRAQGWYWIANKWFPGSDFDAIKARAVDLSGGYFVDEADLIDAVKKWGWLNAEKRARRQLAAVLLNVAAGELYPGNTKCRLFQGTELDFDGDEVADSTVGAEIGNIITGIESGDPNAQNDAFHVALDINLGRSVIGAASFH